MKGHLSEERLNDRRDGRLPPGEEREADRHLDACATCRAALERLRATAGGLAALPATAAPARDLWPEIAARLAREENRERAGALPARRLSPAWLAAAALLLFTCGLALGLALGRGGLGPRRGSAPEAHPGLASAARVQRAGSDYIAALAALRGAASKADPAAVRQGRDAALAALWGAAEELRRLAPGDPGAARVQREVEAVRRGAEPDDPANAGLTWF